MRAARALDAVLISLTAMVLGGASAPPDAGRPPEARFPASLTDIDGRSLDMEALARDRNLVVVTLKATWCPVCQTQLVRLRERLPDLLRCEVTFVVLAPGPAVELAAIRERTGFDFPFVADEGLAIARSLGLALGAEEILPCMLQILPDGRIGWRQLGRNGAYFGDAELEEFFDCTRAA
jgi:peroxiredoxin